MNNGNHINFGTENDVRKSAFMLNKAKFKLIFLGCIPIGWIGEEKL